MDLLPERHALSQHASEDLQRGGRSHARAHHHAATFGGPTLTSAPLSVGGLLPPGASLYLQALYNAPAEPGQVGITNALRVEWF